MAAVINSLLPSLKIYGLVYAQSMMFFAMNPSPKLRTLGCGSFNHPHMLGSMSERGRRGVGMGLLDHDHED